MPRVGPSNIVTGTEWRGEWPIGPIAAGIAAAAEAVRHAIVNIANAATHAVKPQIRLGGVSSTQFRAQPGRSSILGTLPVVSAGAITHA